MRSRVRPLPFLLTACLVLVSAAAQARPMDDVRRPELIYGARFDDRGLTLRVRSNGCTRKDHFDLHVSPTRRETRVMAVRTKPDRCKALVRGGVDLTWTHSELRIARGSTVRIMNRFRAW